MIITGFPRSGSSLLLLLLANSATEITVRAHREGIADPGEWSKDPFAAIRHPRREDVIFMVRDPQEVVSSDTHGKFSGWVTGWKKSEGQAPYGLESHWKAMQGRPKPMIRYEELIDSPERVQGWFEWAFGIHFDRDWRDWPFGEIDDYWLQSLGRPRPLARRRWYAKRATMERANTLMAKHEGMRECVRQLGY